jgi:2-iminobutanoate/2-iminopropanoate deaminase
MKESIVTDRVPQAIGPYAQAVRVKPCEALFCSGQIPIDPANGQFERAAGSATEQFMKTLKPSLNQWDYQDDIVKTTIFLTDLGSICFLTKSYESNFSRVIRPFYSAVPP